MSCRAIAESNRNDIQVVAINDLGPVETNAPSAAIRFRAWPVSRRNQGHERLNRLRRRADHSDRNPRSARIAS